MASSALPPGLIECAICLGEQTVPRTLPCLHSFCETCLETHVKISTSKVHSSGRYQDPTSDRFMHSNLYKTGQYFPCPTCREVTALPSEGITGFRKDFRIIEFTEVWKNLSCGKFILCDFCNGTITSGASFCVDCQKNFCESCCTSHNEKTVLNAHVMIKITGNNSASLSKCEKHRSESTKYHCEDCKVKICVMCVLGNTHRNHKVTGVNKTLSSKRAELKSCIDHLNNQIWTLQEILFNLTCMEGRLKGKYDETKLQMRKNSRLDGTKALRKEARHIHELDQSYNERTTEVFRRKQQCNEYLLLIKNLQTQLNAILQLEDYKKIPEDCTGILKELQQIDLNTDYKKKVLRLSDPLTGLSPCVQSQRVNKIAHRLECNSYVANNSQETLYRYNASTYTDQDNLYSPHVIACASDATYAMHSQLSLTPVKRLSVYDPRNYASNNKPLQRNSSLPCAKLLFTVGERGKGMGQFDLPYNATFDNHGLLIVAENGNNRLQVIDNEGHSVAEINLKGKCIPRCVALHNDQFAVTDEDSKTVKIINRSGEIVGTLLDDMDSFPFRITCLSNGSLAVSDIVYKCIYIISANGRVKTFDGAHVGRLENPSYLCSGPDGNILVTDSGHHNVKIFDKNGNFLYEFGGYGSGRGQMKYPKGIACDRNGNIFVADSGNDRVVMFSELGCYVGTLADRTYGLIRPMGLAYTSREGGKLAITMPDLNVVTVYELTPTIPEDLH